MTTTNTLLSFGLSLHNARTHTMITQPDHVLTCTCVYEFPYFDAFQPTIRYKWFHTECILGAGNCNWYLTLSVEEIPLIFPIPYCTWWLDN